MDEERHKKLEAGKQKFAEFLKKKNSTDKKKRKRRTGSPICEMNGLIMNENVNPNHLINGNSKSDEMSGNIGLDFNDFNDESISSESNALQLYEALKQKDALIKQLSERLQVTLQSRDESAEVMTLQIEQLKHQLRLLSTKFLNKTIEEQPILSDFECQTEWTEESSIESMRRQSVLDISNDVIRVGVNSLNAIMEDKSEQTIECEKPVEDSLLHRNCREELEREKLKLVIEFTEREKKTELALLEQVNQLEQQMRIDRQTYVEENKKLDNQINSLKSQINHLERRQRCEDSDEDLHNFKTRVSQSSSPLHPNSPFLPNLSENERHSSSRSPIQAHVQNRNNWSQNHHSYTAPSLDADIESCWHLYAAQTNSRLLHVLSDLVKTFLDTEHDIQKQLEEMGIESNGTNKEELPGFISLGEDAMERLSESNELCEDGPDLTPSSNLLYLTPPSTFMSGQSEVEVEDDVVLGASRRLRAAVDRILKLLSEIVAAHQEHDFNSVLKRNEELVSELNEECTRRDKLTAQLLQIEDRVKTLEKEKFTLSEKVIDYNESKRQMESMRAKIDEYEAERDKWVNDNKRLEKEKCTFAQGLPQLQQISNNSTAQIALCKNTELVNDNDALNSDVRQLQQERIKLLQRIHALTLESEHLRSERDDILDEKRRESEDFEAQIEANEKNLLSYRKFIDEQTYERELERDDYNKELLALKERLKEKDKIEAKLRARLEELESQINSLTEDKYLKEKQFNDMSSQLKSANHEISELRAVITQLEKESDKCHQLERHLRTKVNDLNEALELQIKINEESQQDVFTTSILQTITTKTHQLQNTLGSIDCESESEDTSIECSYNDVRQLSEKLNALNDCIDKLLVQNNSLKSELERVRNESKQDYQQLLNEKHQIESKLKFRLKTVETQFTSLTEEKCLQEKQLNDMASHLKCANQEISEFRAVITRLERESDKFKQLERHLRTKLNDLNEALESQIRVNKESQPDVFTTSILERIVAKINQLQNTLSVECSNTEDLQLCEKLNTLNDCIDKMVLQNNSLKSELERVRNENKQDISHELLKEKDWKLQLKLKRIISHKNALIYQKKYLLHVLGGFQLTERATLALLANMNVIVDDESPAFQSGRNRFRSVVYSIIAISRMKVLVNKWKYYNLPKSKSTIVKTMSTNSLGATNESQTNSTLQEFVNRLQRLHDTLGLRSGQI